LNGKTDRFHALVVLLEGRLDSGHVIGFGRSLINQLLNQFRNIKIPQTETVEWANHRLGRPSSIAGNNFDAIIREDDC
jgi:hypothetical protein